MVHKGEILGFAGLVGAGRSEIMEAVFGARPYDAGQIFMNGDEVHFKNPMQAIKSGIALVPEDRKKQWLEDRKVAGRYFIMTTRIVAIVRMFFEDKTNRFIFQSKFLNLFFTQRFYIVICKRW